MSTLEISLIVLVVATLAGVVALNMLQTRRARGPGRAGDTGSLRAAADQGAPATPALSGRTEPSLGSAQPAGPFRSGPAQGADGGPGAGGMTARLSAAGLAAESGPPGATPVRPAILSDLCDCIVELPLPAPMSGERLLALCQSFRRVGAKPVAIEGLPADGEPAVEGSSEPRLSTGPRWIMLATGLQFSEIRAGVLLANRHGPLNAMEYSEFASELNGLAEQVSALPDMPDMASVLERARALDAKCIKLDAQIGVNVDCHETLSTVDLERIARDQRLVERGNNRYARLGEHGEMLFSVALADAPNRLTFLLDVPRAPVGQSPWPALVQCAHDCAKLLQGGLVDDGGRALAQAALDRIGEQLEGRYAALENAGLVAGSPLALRLFN